MLDHILGRPSVKSRRLQVLAALAFWGTYVLRGNRHGPPIVRRLSKYSSKTLTVWQTVVFTMLYLYLARNLSTVIGLASPEPMANMYDATYFRATWVLTALDAGFWTAMKIKRKWARDIASVVFSVYYLIAAERADEKVRKVRGMLTVEHLRVSWNKGTSPYLGFFQNLLRPRFTRWPPRAIRIPRPSTSDYKETVSGWLFYDGPISDLQHINKMILDIPGGGFVAMDPRCNDDKLFAWAGKTGLPILSLDYHKAPEYPFPYALNECFDVYATIIRSQGRCIGMSGRETPKVVVTGDSAGGNLATAMTLMIIENSQSNRQHGADLPVPDGLVLMYPGLDMNIGSWMSDEQMALVNDRRMRGTNKHYLRGKSMQYNDLVGTPHQSGDEDDAGPPPQAKLATTTQPEALKIETDTNPQPKYSHASPQTWPESVPPSPISQRRRGNDGSGIKSGGSGGGHKRTLSHRPEPMRTRLAMASMISYFNDRVLTPEMMRAMIILYIGPHNRPDFSQDYLLSPILAPDSLLERFPKTYFLTGERDPLVDDTVIFAGRLRRVKRALHVQTQQSTRAGLDEELGIFGQGDDEAERRPRRRHVVADFDDKDVCEVVLIPGISHGFTQFPSLYPPAWRLIDRCARWAVDLLGKAETRGRERETRASARGMAMGLGGDEEEEEVEESGTTGDSETRGRGEESGELQENSTRIKAGRHHRRVESSGDEDRPLEISMTARRGGRRTASDDNRKKGVNGEGAKEGEGGDNAKQQQQQQQYQAGGGRGRGGKSGPKKSKSLVKLDSSDDLLGRRMQGLAGGLTGMGDDDD